MSILVSNFALPLTRRVLRGSRRGGGNIIALTDRGKRLESTAVVTGLFVAVSLSPTQYILGCLIIKNAVFLIRLFRTWCMVCTTENYLTLICSSLLISRFI